MIIGNIILSSLSIIFALICRGIIDSAASGNINKMFLYAAVFFSIIVSQFILRLFCRSLEERIRAGLEISYKRFLFDQILNKDYMKVTSYHTGELLNRLFSDVAIVSDGVTTILPNFTSMITRLVLAFFVLVVLDYRFAFVFLGAGITLYFVSKVLRGKIKQLHRLVQEKDGIVRSFLQEALENLLILKVFSVEDKMNERLDVVQADYYTANMKRKNIRIIANAGFSFIFQLGYFIALSWSAYELFTGSMTFGTLTAVLQLVNQVQQPFAVLSGLLPKFYGVLSSAERMREIEKLSDEVGDGRRYNALELYSHMKNIVFNDISFKYDRDIILKDSNLVIEKGDFIAITGISGIGKSTLLKLLLGIYPVAKGEIYLELQDNTKLICDKNLRNLFAYVPQGNMILSGTIKENLTFINGRVSDSEIEKAVRVSCIDAFIKDMPAGLDTVIGEKGHGLSEGQVQRLAIARALLSKSPVLLLDEATSALDEETEVRLLYNLKQIRDVTLIIISHKKAALDICNKEVKIQKGKIITNIKQV